MVKKLENEEDRKYPFSASAPKKLIVNFDMKSAMERKTRSQRLTELMYNYVNNEEKEDERKKKR